MSKFVVIDDYNGETFEFETIEEAIAFVNDELIPSCLDESWNIDQVESISILKKIGAPVRKVLAVMSDCDYDEGMGIHTDKNGKEWNFGDNDEIWEYEVEVF